MSGNHDGLWALPRIGRQAHTMGILVKGKKVKIQKKPLPTRKRFHLNAAMTIIQ